MTDPDGTIVECNQMTLELHGCASKDDIIGRNAIEFVAPEDHDRVAENTKKALEQGSVKNIEYTLLRKDGQTFPGEIIEATSGQEGLDTAMAFHPDLILMDLVMPEMDGCETTRRIRQVSDLKDVIVIGVPASVFGQTREEALAANCDDFLTKPVDLNTLLEKVKKFLNVEWIYVDEEDGRHVDGHHLAGGVHLAGNIDGRHFESGDHLAEPITPPPREELSQLYDLAMIGDIMGIRERIEAIAALDPKFTSFVVKLRQLAKDLKIGKIQACLQEYLEEEQ